MLKPILKRKKLLILILLVAIVLGLGAYFLFKPAAEQALTAPTVIVSTAQVQNVPITITSLGNLVAPQATMLSTQQSGVVKQIYFKNGQNVSKGTLLVQLDDTAARAVYNKDKAALNEAQMQYQRYMALNRVDPSVLSKLQIDQVYATYQEAKATVEGDAENLAQMQIRAPFAGILGATNISVGTFLDVGAQVVAIVNPNILEVSYPVPENYIAMVSLNQKVNLTTDAYPGKTIMGTVVFKSPLVDPSSRAFTVRARVDNPQGLSSGMLVHITQILVPDHMVLAVPTSALVSEMSGSAIYQVQNGKVIETYVETGAQFGDYTEITSGLQAGANIIVQGNQKVQPGMTVQAETQAVVSGS